VKLGNISIGARGILDEILNRRLQNAQSHYRLKRIPRVMKIYYFVTKCDANTNIAAKNYFLVFSR